MTVYGVCDGADGELQLALEYCEGGSLLDWLRRLDKVCVAGVVCAAAARSHFSFFSVCRACVRLCVSCVVVRSRCRRRRMC